MNSLNTLIEEAQNLQQQLALTASALIGHLEVYGSKNGSVYAVALCGQATENTKAAGRIIDLLTRLNKPEGVATAANNHEPVHEEDLAQPVEAERLLNVVDLDANPIENETVPMSFLEVWGMILSEEEEKEEED